MLYKSTAELRIKTNQHNVNDSGHKLHPRGKPVESSDAFAERCTTKLRLVGATEREPLSVKTNLVLFLICASAGAKQPAPPLATLCQA